MSVLDSVLLSLLVVFVVFAAWVIRYELNYQRIPALEHAAVSWWNHRVGRGRQSVTISSQDLCTTMFTSQVVEKLEARLKANRDLRVRIYAGRVLDKLNGENPLYQLWQRGEYGERVKLTLLAEAPKVQFVLVDGRHILHNPGPPLGLIVISNNPGRGKRLERQLQNMVASTEVVSHPEFREQHSARRLA